MEEFIHQQNLILFKKQIADEAKDEVKRNMLMRLLAEEEAKELLPTAK